MGNPSIDLRERVVDAAVRGGLSRSQAAARYDTGESTAVRLGGAVP